VGNNPVCVFPEGAIERQLSREAACGNRKILPPETTDNQHRRQGGNYNTSYCYGEPESLAVFISGEGKTLGHLALHAAHHVLHAALGHFFHHLLHLRELLEQAIHILNLGPGTCRDTPPP